MTLEPRSGARPARRWRVPGPGVACVLVVLAIVAACGSSEPDPGPTPSGSHDGSATPGPTPSGSGPSPSASGPSEPSGSVRLSGVVRTSPEDRVVALEARAGGGQPARTWILIGPVRSLQDGERVTVVGRPAPDAETTTQRGPVFQVESVTR